MPALFDRAIFTSVTILAMRATILACKFGLVIFIGHYLDLTSLGLYGLAAGAVSLGPVMIGWAWFISSCEMQSRVRYTR